MSVNIFETRTMLAALEKMFPPTLFFKKLFFSADVPVMTKHVDIDVFKRKRRMAAFVKSVSEAKVVERTSFDRQKLEPPYIKIKMVTTAEDILKTQPGQHIYQSGGSPAERAATQLGKDIAELQDMVMRRIEWMAARALQDGKVTLTGEFSNYEIDFLMQVSHQPTAAIDWDNSSADIVGDLITWARLCSQDGGLYPTDIVLGSDVVPAFLDHDQIRQLLDNRRIMIGEVAPVIIEDDAASFIGKIRVPGLSANLWSYDGNYIDEAGASKFYMDAKKVVMGSSRARTSTIYGAIQDLDFGGLASVPFFPKSWVVPDPSARWVMVQSAPVCVPHDIDAFLSATVLS